MEIRENAFISLSTNTHWIDKNSLLKFVNDVYSCISLFM